MNLNNYLGGMVGVPELVVILCKLDLVEASVGVVVGVIHNTIVYLDKEDKRVWPNFLHLLDQEKGFRKLLQSCETLQLV